MIRRTLLAGLAALGLTIPTAMAHAQPLPRTTPMLVPAPLAVSPHRHHFHVEYRQVRWQERSFSSEFEARRFESDLRARGFEVRHQHHRGHIDVSYRLAGWATYGMAQNRLEARGMIAQLRGQGYEARIVPH